MKHQAQQIVFDNMIYFIESDDWQGTYLIKEENSIIWHHIKMSCYNALVFNFGSKVNISWGWVNWFEVFKQEIIKRGK